METLKEYCNEAILKMIFILWGASAIVIAFDTVVNPLENPLWMIRLNVILILLLIILIVGFHWLRTYYCTLFVVYCYLFSVYMFLPGLIGDEALRATIISSETRLVASILYILFLGLIGGGKQIIYLGLFNFVMVLAVIFESRFFHQIDLEVDFTILLILFVFPILYYWFISYVQVQLEHLWQEYQHKSIETASFLSLLCN